MEHGQHNLPMTAPPLQNRRFAPQTRRIQQDAVGLLQNRPTLTLSFLHRNIRADRVRLRFFIGGKHPHTGTIDRQLRRPPCGKNGLFDAAPDRMFHGRNPDGTAETGHPPGRWLPADRQKRDFIPCGQSGAAADPEVISAGFDKTADFAAARLPQRGALARCPAARNEQQPVTGKVASSNLLRPDKIERKPGLQQRPPGHDPPQERFVPEQRTGLFRSRFRYRESVSGHSIRHDFCSRQTASCKYVIGEFNAAPGPSRLIGQRQARRASSR